MLSNSQRGLEAGRVQETLTKPIHIEMKYPPDLLSAWNDIK